MAPLLVRLLCAACLAGLMLAQVWLANGIVHRRTAVARLSGEREYLVTRVGQLRLAWHRAAGREAVTARAARELGLVAGDGPAPLLVVRERATTRPGPWWQRALVALGSGRGVPEVAAREREP